MQTSKPKKKPEYRGFRCACCQRYVRKAWHHWCERSHYKTPVHICNKCEFNYISHKTKIIGPKISIDIRKFSSIQEFPEQLRKELEKIVDGWNTKSPPVYKTFTCDSCGEKMHKAYHFWFRRKGTLSEAHFCKKCGDRLGLDRLK